MIIKELYSYSLWFVHNKHLIWGLCVFSRTHGIIFYSYICFRRYDRESTVHLLCLAVIMKGKINCTND